MKLKTLLAAAAIALPFTAANATEVIPENSLKLSEIASKVEAQGYEKITEISLDDSVWEAEASKNNMRYELKVSPTDGKIISEKEDKW